MSYRNKTYIAFDGDNDMKYYNLLRAWSENDNIDFDFYNAHELTQVHDWAQTETIKRSLRERMNNSKLLILLIGEYTKRLTKFVEYEVETGMRQELPIICVNLNGSKEKDSLAPKWMDEYPVLYIPFEKTIIKFAMEKWPEEFRQYLRRGNTGAFRYSDFFKEFVKSSVFSY